MDQPRLSKTLRSLFLNPFWKKLRTCSGLLRNCWQAPGVILAPGSTLPYLLSLPVRPCSWCTNNLDQTALQQSIICIVQSSSFWFSLKDHIVQNPIFGQRARVCICNLICSRVRIHIRWGILIYLVCENIKNSVAFVL